MKRVYILINHLQVQDGVARTAIGLANELVDNNIEVTLQSLFKYDSNMRQWLSPKVKTKRFLGFYFRGLAKIVSLIPKKWLYKILVRDKYDIEIGFCMNLPIEIIAASNNNECKHYAWMHGYDEGLTLLNCYKKMDKVMCVSKCNAERFKKDSNYKIPVETCYNLIDNNRICRMATEDIDIKRKECMTFVVVGRLEYGKGVLRLIECFGKLKKNGYLFNLWIIGDGEQRQQLEDCTKDLGISEDVVFLGSQRNPHKYTSKSDVLVCASYSEGYSTACIEAIMLGIPVLTTNVSGAEEIISDAKSGMVVGMNDEDLYCGLKYILDNEYVVNEWKEKLEETKDTFSYSNRAQNIYKVLDIQILGKRGNNESFN